MSNNITKKYILGVDQGTTGTTTLVMDENWDIVSRGYIEHEQIYPKPGWVEHDPMEIWDKTKESIRLALEAGKIDIEEIKALGLDNQGETVMLWNKVTGLPVYNALVWQDKRTAEEADQLKEEWDEKIRNKTGLIPDAYFSALKIKWVLDNVEGVREGVAKGEILAGTLDTWLIWKLTGGKVYITDGSTAARTMLLNICQGDWDEEILEKLDIPRSILPDIHPSSKIFGYTDPAVFFNCKLPISASIVDQPAALFGQACFEPGMVKTTYGTGCFMEMNTGDEVVSSKNDLLSIIAWRLGDKNTYALEGGVYITGAAVQWLRDGLQIIDNVAETEQMALSVPDNGGVYFVPAFAGLAAPYWDQYARGMMIGITGGTTRAHIVRATLEGIAFQVKEILDAMRKDSGIAIDVMRVDGGAVANKFLMQFQADILGIPVDVPEITETTALGAAYLAALGIGVFDSLDDIKDNWKLGKRFVPQMGTEERGKLCSNWSKAVERSRNWEKEIA
ncbi:MAG: glycerol kinase GlpK [Candidatus Neomarinimicrobiota bacterium]|nr:glycerol kinase GlpK [Candidatus Neomarinimicrobiota bacterium]